MSYISSGFSSIGAESGVPACESSMESWLFAPFLEEKSGLEKNPFFPALSSFLTDSVISSFIGLMSAEAEIGLVRAVLALSETAGGSEPLPGQMV